MFTKVLWAAKIYKRDITLRPIVSSIGSMSGVAKKLARILKPLIGKTIYHVNNSKDFADKLRSTKTEEGRCITSYDVTAFSHQFQ